MSVSATSAVPGHERSQSKPPLAARELRAMLQRLSCATAVDELFAEASLEACTACGFDRGVVLGVDRGALTATVTGAIKDRACDGLRRAALARRLPVEPDSEEARIVRRPDVARCAQHPVSAALREALGLRHELLAPVAPEGRTVAVLVLDRATHAPDDRDRERLEAVAHVLEVALERLVLHQRLTQLSDAFRHITSSAQVLAHEAVHGPVGLPTDSGRELMFDAVPHAGGGGAPGTLDGLTERERQIAAQLVAGRSNREIASELHLSPETVKGNIARMLRKLGVANRVEAVAKLSRAAHAEDGSAPPLRPRG